MGYRFVFGASGAGKSYTLQQEAIALSLAQEARPREERSRLFYIVPEQFTMQTQKALVEAHPRHGIWDIDVLSLGRLAHRVFEETSADRRLLLDDTGKSLILRRVAAEHEKELVTLRGRLDRVGMIAEVKSILSEFMQYGIGEEELERMIACARDGEREALCRRLKDLSVLYRAFLEFKRTRFLTSEETMTLLAEAIPASPLIRGSVLFFDGFTGFTPVQYPVLAALMQHAKEVVFSFPYAPDGEKDPQTAMESADPGREDALFFLTRKTVCDIAALAAERGILHNEDTYLTPKAPPRFAKNPGLAHLERHLYRYPLTAAPEKTAKERIHLYCCDTPEGEVCSVFGAMLRLMRQKGYAYRDFAVLCGDLGRYGPLFENMSLRYRIPVYVDHTHAVGNNMLIQAIRGALTLRREGMSHAGVFSYLRSGFSSLTEDEVDRLENHCLANGIRSRAKWELPFGEELDKARLCFLEEVRPLYEDGLAVAEKTKALSAFLEAGGMREKAEQYADDFASEGKHLLAMEYRRIYDEVQRLLEQVEELLGEETMSQEDFRDLLEAGFAELRLGMLPQSVDSVVVGDNERTRLAGVKVLFFVGVQDGVVPRQAAGGGLLSDFEREFLAGSGHALAPTPRQELFRQRFYLYWNLTRPADRLVLTYALTATDGSPERPSPLIGQIKALFPDLAIETPETAPLSERLADREDMLYFVSRMLPWYVRRGLKENEEAAFFTIYAGMAAGGEDSAARARRLKQLAFLRYDPAKLPAKAVQTLYRDPLRGSVSRLEIMAQCAYRHFLQYGLHLREREEYAVQVADTGSVLHQSLHRFDELLHEKNLTWKSFSDAEADALTAQALEETAARYRNLLLYETARDAGRLPRLLRILRRSVRTLRFQLSRGNFLPEATEVDFGGAAGADLEFALKGGRALELRGRVDRYDVAQAGQKRYVKIVDYKTGLKDLDPDKIREGLQLQLPLYMEAVKRREESLHPEAEVLPAALLYYRMTDPVLNEAGEQEVYKALRPKGLLNGNPEALRLLDNTEPEESLVVPLSRKKDGGMKASSGVMAEADFVRLLEEAGKVACALSEEIYSGRIPKNPRVLDTYTSCTYCPYQGACGFDERLPGCTLQ